MVSDGNRRAAGVAWPQVAQGVFGSSGSRDPPISLNRNIQTLIVDSFMDIGRSGP